MTETLAYSYIRMSSEIQLRGDSLRRQSDASAQYAEKNGLKLVPETELRDIGVSAYKGDNVETGALGRFVAAVEANEIPRGSYLLVESLDRISRQQIDVSLALFLRIIGCGVVLVTLNDNQIYSAPFNDLTKLITSIVHLSRANEESEIKSRRIGAAWENKRKHAASRVVTRKCPAWLKLKDDLEGFEVQFGAADVVKRIFRLAADGAGSELITKTLNSEGAPTLGKSKGWVESYITKILKNRAVLGEFQPHKLVGGKRTPAGEPVYGYYPAVIDEETFLKVQAGRRLRNAGQGGRRGKAQSNLFTHIAKCGYCDAPMRFVNKGVGPKGGQYLQCSAARRGLPCFRKSWRYSAFETSVLTFLKEFDLASAINASETRKKLQLLRAQKIALNEKLIFQKQGQERVLEAITYSADSGPILRGKLEEIVGIIKRLEAEVFEIDREIKEAQHSADEKDPAEVANQIQEFSKSSQPLERVAVAGKLKELLTVITVFADGNRPKTLEFADLVYDGDMPEEEKSAILQAILANRQDSDLVNPHFIIVLRDGLHRLVVPKVSQPDELQLSVEVDGTYEPRYRGDGAFKFDRLNIGNQELQLLSRVRLEK
jgi:DNA invertase Pin-like site-specific DNA recombinase